MTADDLLAALSLPAGTIVDQKVSKKLLIENGAPTAADKRAINEGVEECRWIAALKPNTVGIPEYRDADRDYLEVHVLRVDLRPEAKNHRLIELVHRAIPYPLVLVHSAPASVGISTAHKRKSLGEADRVVLDGVPAIAEPLTHPFQAFAEPFRQALTLAKQPQGTLLKLYGGWCDTILALHAARRTGRFTVTATPEESAARREALQRCAAIEADMNRIRAAATRETQVAKQAELNLQLQKARRELEAILQSLVEHAPGR